MGNEVSQGPCSIATSRENTRVVICTLFSKAVLIVLGFAFNLMAVHKLKYSADTLGECGFDGLFDHCINNTSV